MDPEPTPSDIYPRRDEYNSEKKKKTSQAKKVSPLWVGLIERPRTLYTHTFSSVCIYILEWKKGKEKKKIYKRTIEWGPFCFPSHPWNPYSFLWPPVARTVPVHTHIYPSEILNKSNSHWSEGAGFFRVSAADRGTFISLHVWYLEPPRNKKKSSSPRTKYIRRGAIVDWVISTPRRGINNQISYCL